MTYDLVVTCLENQNLPPNLRTAFSELLLRLYVDIEPFENQNFLNLTRVWSDLGSKEISSYGSSGEGSREAIIKNNQNFNRLKSFVIDHMIQHSSQVISDMKTNSLTLSVSCSLFSLLFHSFSLLFRL